MAEIIKLGSLYLDGAPAKCGAAVGNQNLKIGDTHTGKELSWIKANGLLVADHVVCTSISWEDLDSQGFIFGVSVQIDGVPYLCRSLKVGNEEETPNEWDTILDATSEDNSIWSWNNKYFWGQETPKEYASYRAIRGYISARHWYYFSVSSRHVYVGFRPVLEPLVPDNLISDPLVGKPVRVYGPDGNISGILTGISNYDLFLSPAGNTVPIPICKWCCQQEDGTIIVARPVVAITKECIT